MGENIELTERERDALSQLREKLLARGIRISDEKFIMALLKAAAQLPQEDLLALVREGMLQGGPGSDGELLSPRDASCSSHPKKQR